LQLSVARRRPGVLAPLFSAELILDASRLVAGNVSRTACGADAEGASTGAFILALAHRGVTHVRGKDCVHPDIGRVVVKDDLFSCPGERTTGAQGVR
jgi:hypothetical protein